MTQDPLNLYELEPMARARLEPMAYDYYRGGADDEVTVRRNNEAYERLEIFYRVLVDVGRREKSLCLFGQELSMPVIVAPVAFLKMAHPEGESAVARAAVRAGTVMVLSTLSTTPVAAVAAQAGGKLWFQLYVYRDRGVTAELVRAAEESGCTALFVTVDNPVLGRRERDLRNGFHLPDHLFAENLTGLENRQVGACPGGSGLSAYVGSLMDPCLSWNDIAWLKERTALPVVLKGIVRGDDARRAIECGADGIVVSNHGGRQLDTAPATIDALADVVQAAGGRVPVLVDGGIRRGTHVLKALALGASAVLVGRPVVWGLAVSGEAGVSSVLAMLADELDLAMALAGCPNLSAITGDLVRRRD